MTSWNARRGGSRGRDTHGSRFQKDFGPGTRVHQVPACDRDGRKAGLGDESSTNLPAVGVPDNTPAHRGLALKGQVEPSVAEIEIYRSDDANWIPCLYGCCLQRLERFERLWSAPTQGKLVGIVVRVYGCAVVNPGVFITLIRNPLEPCVDVSLVRGPHRPGIPYAYLIRRVVIAGNDEGVAGRSAVTVEQRGSSSNRSRARKKIRLRKGGGVGVIPTDQNGGLPILDFMSAAYSQK